MLGGPLSKNKIIKRDGKLWVTCNRGEALADIDAMLEAGALVHDAREFRLAAA